MIVFLKVSCYMGILCYKIFTHFLALSSIKEQRVLSLRVAISNRRLQNLLCHSLQCERMANLRGEQSSTINSTLLMVSCFCTLFDHSPNGPYLDQTGSTVLMYYTYTVHTSYIHILTHACMHMHTHTRTRTHTHTHTHTHVYTVTHKRTHMHTHTTLHYSTLNYTTDIHILTFEYQHQTEKQRDLKCDTAEKMPPSVFPI